MLIYRILIYIFFPFLIILIYIRKYLGKEDTKRFVEKISIKKNVTLGKEVELIWFHGASIGEVKSIFPLISLLSKINKDINFLITSTTLSSGKIIEERFKGKKNIFYRYFPLDVPFLVKDFLDTWKPNIAGFVDSEIWPNFIFEIKKRDIKLILINARLTKKTLRRWKVLKNFSKKIFLSFNSFFPASRESMNNLKELNVKNIKYFGNLKYSITDEKSELISGTNLQNLIKHNVWCASSIHLGEEIFCIDVHLLMKKKLDNIITIIIPRHIKNINKIFSQCKRYNINAQILNKNDLIDTRAEIILVNTFGELNKYYNFCNSVFIGKSLMKKKILVGGQNPIEAALKGCKVYHGPYVYNFQEVYNYLNSINISEKVTSAADLSNKLIFDFSNKDNNSNEKILKLKNHGAGILNQTANEIIKLLRK